MSRGVCKVRLCVDTNLDSAVVVDCQTPQFLVCLRRSNRDHRDLLDVFAKWGPLSAIWPGSIRKMVWYCVMRQCSCNVCAKVKVLLSFSFITLSLFLIIVHLFVGTSDRLAIRVRFVFLGQSWCLWFATSTQPGGPATLLPRTSGTQEVMRNLRS